MSTQPETVDAVVWLQVEPIASMWRTEVDANGLRILTGAKVISHTQKRPTQQQPGTILTKITLRIPSAAFLPLLPEAIVVVPSDLVHGEPLEVTATDAHETTTPTEETTAP